MIFFKYEIYIIYFLSKFNGLIPFQFSKNFQKVYIDTNSTMYTLFFAILFVGILVLSTVNYFLSSIFIDIKPSFVHKLVVNFEYVMMTSFTTLTVLKHFIHRKKLIFLVNYIICIWKDMLHLFPANDQIQQLISALIKEYGFRLIISCAQLCILVILMVYGIATFQNKINKMQYFYWYASLYINLVNSIALSFYYYGAMSICLTSYRKINKTIMELFDASEFHSTHINMQKYCKISDFIDRLAIIYGRIHFFIRGVNECYQFQAILVVFSAFTQLTAAVNQNNIFIGKLLKFNFLFFYKKMFTSYKFILSNLSNSGDMKFKQITFLVQIAVFYQTEVYAFASVTTLLKKEVNIIK